MSLPMQATNECPRWRERVSPRSISKQGDRYIRGLFVAGALAVIRYAKIHGTKHRPCALANKIARMAWAMMARGEHYNEPVALAR
jgi:transposase